LPDGEILVCRPLLPTDGKALTAFLAGLSARTRRLSTFDGYDLTEATKLCAAIGLYDKLRLVVVNSAGRIVGLFELSFGIPPGDIARYNTYGISLDECSDCRFGPTLSDDYQHHGIGPLAFAWIQVLVQQFGKRRIILWGGVLADNHAAISYYQKLGFVSVGKFTQDTQENYDMLYDQISGRLPEPLTGNLAQ
jgi:GNAT superfamily N-acetyltransferase